MAEPSLEHALRNLPAIGTLVKDRGYRQVWRFEFASKAYFLKFYPRTGKRDWFRRFTRGSPAMAEFVRLQWLQKASIPAPRAVACLTGMTVQERRGDAVILQAVEPSVQLDSLLSELEWRGEPIPDHLQLATQLRDLLQQLAVARLGHSDLHLGNLLLHDGKLLLLDGYAVHTGGLTANDLYFFAHSVSRYATLTDLQRGWDQLGPGGRMPLQNPVTQRLARDWMWRVTDDNRYFGAVTSGPWHGHFFRQEKHPRRWSSASALQIEQSDWDAALPDLLRRMENDQLQVLKRSRSGDVLAAEVSLGGRAVPIIIKRPRRRYWYRYINEIGRGVRARRAWMKAWKLIIRNLPTAWPLLLLEQRTLGYVTDALVIFERVPGRTLSSTDLDAMAAEPRDMLFRRIGRILRKLEQHGFAHFDAKASNWIVREDPKFGPSPVLIDVDGVRQRRWAALGIRRLLRSLRQHKQYAPPDSLALCQGYAPYAPLYLDRETPPAPELLPQETAS